MMSLHPACCASGPCASKVWLNRLISASAVFSTLRRAVLVTKRNNHGSAWGKYDQRTLSGPIGSERYPGTFDMMPGMAMGTHDPGDKIPALPNDVYSPGGNLSITVTSWPSRRRYAAVAMPTMPAPMMAIFFMLVPECDGAILAALHERRRMHWSVADCPAAINYGKIGSTCCVSCFC